MLAEKHGAARMSRDDSETAYHLTPRGWETGDPAPDRAETWIRSIHQQSGWSKEYVGWACQWADQNVARAERDKLRAKHKVFMGVAGRSGDRITTIGEPHPPRSERREAPRRRDRQRRQSDADCDGRGNRGGAARKKSRSCEFGSSRWHQRRARQGRQIDP